MRNKLLLPAVFVCLISGQIYAQTGRPPGNIKIDSKARAAQTSNNSQVLPIRRVILYSNGVAYIERRGTISGDAEVNLSFKQSQVDDVLKSMIVLDSGAGKIGAVSYNSSAPASARVAEIPFNVASKSEETDEETGGLAGVLAQLQGAEVVVASVKGATATGSILTVEKRKVTRKNKDEEETSTPLGYSLVIASAAGEISSFDLAEIRYRQWRKLFSPAQNPTNRNSRTQARSTTGAGDTLRRCGTLKRRISKSSATAKPVSGRMLSCAPNGITMLSRSLRRWRLKSTKSILPETVRNPPPNRAICGRPCIRPTDFYRRRRIFIFL